MAGLTPSGSPTTGHGTYPPITVSASGGKVYVGGILVCSEDNIIHNGHTNTVYPYDFHADSNFVGSDKVMIEGSPAIRIGDRNGCGDVIAGADDKTTSN